MVSGMKVTAVVLAAGRGTRMESDIPKQYLKIGDKPVLYYSLKAMEDSFIDSVILVTSKEEITYCEEYIVKQYGFQKVTAIIAGGKQRYHSVMNAVMQMEPSDYVFIHDGARPFVTQEMMQRLLCEVEKGGACIAGMPSKDTIKIADEEGYIASTPNRNLVWNIQTPQVFSYDLIYRAYSLLKEKESELLSQGIQITDDAMVVETLLGNKIKLVEGSYCNIKITTPEDLDIAEKFAKKM